MTDPVPSTSHRPLAAALAAAALLTCCAAAPAAAVAPRRTTAGDCARAAGTQARTDRAPDGPRYTVARLRAIDRRLGRRLASTGRLRAATGSGLRLRVAVHVHAIGGDTARGISRSRARRQVDALNRGYRGAESGAGPATPFRFYLASFERVRNERWRTASIDTAAERRMRRALHVGGRDELNLYVARPGDRTRGTLLGWSSTPWRVRERPRLDGVTVHEGTLPGGTLSGYDRGDTAVHEVGHWLGLLHPFEGGCSQPNDLVDDTPEEGGPSSTCDPGKDTCSAPGTDPVHNFMDYALDTCMDRFTPGQVSRMTDNWLAYRTP